MTTTNQILQNHGSVLKDHWQNFASNPNIGQMRVPSNKNQNVLTEFKRQKIKNRFLEDVSFELPVDRRVKTRFVYVEETKRSDKSIDPYNFEIYDKESLYVHKESLCEIQNKVTHVGKRKGASGMLITKQTIKTRDDALIATTKDQVTIENRKNGFRFVILNLDQLFGFETIKRAVYTRRFETNMVYFIEGLASETDDTALVSVACDMETMSVTNIECSERIENAIEMHGFLELAGKVFALDPANEMKEIESLCFLTQTRKKQKTKE